MIFVGIDGGGTKTKIVVGTETGEIIWVGNGGPSSLRTVDLETMLVSLEEATKHATKDINIDSADVIFAGLGDVESKSDKLKVEQVIRKLSICKDNTKVIVKSDIYNAQYCGLADYQEGVGVIIGTGSVAFGVNREGLSKRVGGYSYKEGDPGSSYDLGKQCFTYLAKVLDGRRENSNFSKELKQFLKVTDRISYVNMLDEYHTKRTQTAQLAKLVTKHSSSDKDAYNILNNGVLGIVEIIDTAMVSLDIKEKNVAVIGSLGNSKEYFTLLNVELGKIDKSYNVFKHSLDPVIGALIGAYKSYDIQITRSLISVLKNYKI